MTFLSLVFVIPSLRGISGLASKARHSFLLNCELCTVNCELFFGYNILGGVFMVRSKNYDSPFDKEELDNLERQPLLDEEQLYNTEYFEEDYISYPLVNNGFIPSSLNLVGWRSPFFSQEDEAYERYKEIEGLK